MKSLSYLDNDDFFFIRLVPVYSRDLLDFP